MTDRPPWPERYTGGPRGIAALMTGVSFWLLWTLVIVAAGADLFQTAWFSAVAAFAAAVVVIPLAYGGLKHCYDRPPAKAGENVEREQVREWPGNNRIGGRRMYQTGPTSWRIVDDLPEGVSTAVMEDWMRDVWRGRASWNVPSGRERGLGDGTVKRVKEWLEDRRLIDIAANGQWDWTDRGRRLCEALERGYDLGVLLDGRPTETEI